MANHRILDELDRYLHKNDYLSAESYLVEKLSYADASTEILIRNELMGLYRKLGRRKEALEMADAALSKIEDMGITHQVGAATTFLNAATVYKAFSMPGEAMPLFEQARAIYESSLPPTDSRLGGLYNNMGLALVDLRRFDEAKVLYEKAITVMENNENGALEVAITLLNLASAAEAELGLLDAEDAITDYLTRAESLLESHPKQDGYYAFVCEKCASVFGYYGWFVTQRTLTERAERIYQA